MKNENFQPLFEYFDEVKAELKSDINRVEEKVDVLQTSVDGLAKITKDTNEKIIVTEKRQEQLEA